MSIIDFMRVKKVCIIFGGKSVEHEISIISANSILNNINKTKYKIFGIYITKDGVFCEATPSINRKSSEYKFKIDRQKIVLLSNQKNKNLLILKGNKIEAKINIDVFFPIIHGTGGEDGSIQGLLELVNKPYVGCGVESSSICMNKILSKKLVSQQSIPTTAFHSFGKEEWRTSESSLIRKILEDIGLPCFVKASNLGSSVGIYRVATTKELKSRIKDSFKFANELLIEEAVLQPEEVEVSILEKNNIITTVPGRIIPSDEFYSYKAKYIDGKSEIEIPYQRASSNPALMKRIKILSSKVFTVLQCSGMARIDFLYGKTTRKKKPALYFSEINTIPGFTEISMFPKLLNNEGITLEATIEALIKNSESKQRKKEKLVTDFL
jgi:D-alanine-D-alanine ligase